MAKLRCRPLRCRPVLAIAALLALPVDAWVLHSPFARGGRGLGYSRSNNADDASSDWRPDGGAPHTLNQLVWRWPATTSPTDGRGLGKSITYALDPGFCPALLPKFPEDGANGGHLDSFLSMINCGTLKTTIHLAFATWAANNAHVSFLDRTDECARNGSIVDHKCDRAEVLISAADLSSQGGVVAYWLPHVHRFENTPLLTSGVRVTDALGLLEGRMVISTHVCWYLDATFCAALISNFAGADPRLTRRPPSHAMQCPVPTDGVARCALQVSAPPSRPSHASPSSSHSAAPPWSAAAAPASPHAQPTRWHGAQSVQIPMATSGQMPMAQCVCPLPTERVAQCAYAGHRLHPHQMCPRRQWVRRPHGLCPLLPPHTLALPSSPPRAVATWQLP
jgi:hypothetical protein